MPTAALSPQRSSDLPVLSQLETAPEGLSWSEAERRLEEYGPNIAVPHNVPAWYRVLWTWQTNDLEPLIEFSDIERLHRENYPLS